MSKLPFMQFYPADWIQDTQVLTLWGQGAWIKVICGLHVAPNYGTRTWTRPELTTFLNTDEKSISYMIDQLSRVADVVCRDNDGNIADTSDEAWEITITCRRMIRDWERLKSRNDTYKRYNHKRTTRKPRENHTKTTPIYQKSDIRSQISDKEEEDTLLATKVASDPALSVRSFVEDWNREFKNQLPTVEWPLSASRYRKASLRLKEHPSDDWWSEVFTKIGGSKFLLGGGPRGWRCTFDFLIANDANCQRIFEGEYNAEKRQFTTATR